MYFYYYYMHNAKENVESILKQLPDDATYEDILYEIYVNQNIEIGLEQIKNGDIISEDQVLKRVKKWLK